MPPPGILPTGKPELPEAMLPEHLLRENMLRANMLPGSMSPVVPTTGVRALIVPAAAAAAAAVAAASAHGTMVPSVASSLSLAVKGGTERARAKQHRTLLEADSFSGWTCGSNLATSHGLKSCLENFGKRSLRELYAETYAHGEATPLHHASAALHRHLWNLCEPLDMPNHRGHTHT